MFYLLIIMNNLKNKINNLNAQSISKVFAFYVIIFFIIMIY